MFISDSEANERLKSSRNVLTVIDKDGADKAGVEHTQEPPVIVPDEVLEPEDAACSSASGIVNTPDGSLLRKMLGMKATNGRKAGIKNMPVELQAAAAVTAQVTTLANSASSFGISQHHAHELKHGYTNEESQYGYVGGKEDPNKALEKVINEQKRQVRDLAFEKLTKALGLISDDKLMAITDATKLARLSKDLSGVVDKVLPKEQGIPGGVHFHVWRPEMRTEETYDTIVVGG
jgi:hypothetical protein